MQVSLTPQEWRKLRAWAAEEDTTVEAIVSTALRRVLELKPRRTF